MGKKSQTVYACEDKYGKDSELWLKLIDGDKRALERLFMRHYNDLVQYAVRMCSCRDFAEDAIQQLFLKLWESRRELTGSLP